MNPQPAPARHSSKSDGGTRNPQQDRNAQLRITVYTPEATLKHPAVLLREMWRDLKAARELAWRLLIRNISAMYRQTMFGYVWAFLPPLVTTGTFLILRGSGVMDPGDTGIPYVAFTLISTSLWQFFADSLNNPIKSVTSSRAMLIKINFPREALILAGMGEALFNFIIRLSIIALTLIYFQILPPWEAILLFPVGCFFLMILGTMGGLLLTPIGMLYQDISKVLPMFITFLMLLTPVVYAPSGDGTRALLMKFNPVSPVLSATRDWLVTGTTEHLVGFGIVAGTSIFLLFIAWILYRVALPHIIARLGG